MAPWPLPKGKTMDWWQTELQRSIQEERMREHHLLSSWSAESLNLLQLMLQKVPLAATYTAQSNII